MALQSFSGASPWPNTLWCSGGSCLCASQSPGANGLAPQVPTALLPLIKTEQAVPLVLLKKDLCA